MAGVKNGVVRLAMAGAAAGFLLLGGHVAPASAACHFFTVTASPERVTEGAPVEITVTRDANIGPSQVDVATVNDSATAPDDFTALDETASFMLETELTFTVPTIDDSTDEPAETFRVHLSDPGGCMVNPNFELGPDAVVTVEDNDAAPAPASATTNTTAAAGDATAAASAARGASLPSTGQVVAGVGVTGAAAVAAGLTVRRLRRRAS